MVCSKNKLVSLLFFSFYSIIVTFELIFNYSGFTVTTRAEEKKPDKTVITN